jgi:predicted DNA binding protein
MRRLVIEIEATEFATLVDGKELDNLKKIKTIQVLNFIKQDANEILFLASVDFHDPSTKLNEVFNDPNDQLQVLYHSKDGKYTVFFKSKPQSDPIAQDFWAHGGFMLTPLEVKDGKLKMSFLGSAKQVRVIPSVLKKRGIHFKVSQFADANLLPTSPLSQLTEKQRRVLTSAFNLGYYDLPRRIDSRELALKLKIGSSDLIKHRRKAEKRVLSAILSTN